MSRKRVVVTGMGLVSCFGQDVGQFYEKLLNGESAIGILDSEVFHDYSTKIAASIKDFEPGIYLDRKQARRVDPCIAYMIVAAKRAVEDGGFNLDDIAVINKSRCGILIGTGIGGMGTFQVGVETLCNRGYKRLSPFFIPYILTNMGGAMAAIDLGFGGPNYSISTACATGNYCIVQAANHIRNGDADLMLCGGGEAPITTVGMGGFIACKALSQNNNEAESASRPWDDTRDGFVMGEGAGVLMLESLEHAQARSAKIYAEYLGGSMSCDAYHMTDPHPEGLGAATSMQLALEDAGIDASQINYINAHATSTIVGDVAELRATRKVFGSNKNIKINATKSMIGHALGAAGGIEAIATIKAIETSKIHPTINLKNPIEEVEYFDAPTKAIDCNITAAMSNSFGFGGHNSSVIFAPYKA